MLSVATTAKPVAVIKIGTRLISNRGPEVMSAIARTIAAHKEAYNFVIVSSGAVGLGRKALGVTPSKAESTSLKQAYSAIGQPLLIEAWNNIFKWSNLLAAQALYTHSDFRGESHSSEVYQTLQTLFSLSSDRTVVPVINGNDAASSKDIRFGDNDVQAGCVARLLGAQHLIILTSVAGLLDAKQRVIASQEGISNETYALAGGAGDATSTGGMVTKLVGAAIAMSTGRTVTTICDGATDGLDRRLSLALGGTPSAEFTTLLPGSVGTAVNCETLKVLGFSQASSL